MGNQTRPRPGCDRGLRRVLDRALPDGRRDALHRPHQLYAQRRRRPRMAGPCGGLDRRRHDHLDLPVRARAVRPAAGQSPRQLAGAAPRRGQRNRGRPHRPQLQDGAHLGARQGKGIVGGPDRPDRRRHLPVVPGASPLHHPRSPARLHRQDPCLGAELTRTLHRRHLRRDLARGPQLPRLLCHQCESLLPACGLSQPARAGLSRGGQSLAAPQPRCLHRLRSRRQHMDAQAVAAGGRDRAPADPCRQHDPQCRPLDEPRLAAAQGGDLHRDAAFDRQSLCRLSADLGLWRGRGG